MYDLETCWNAAHDGGAQSKSKPGTIDRHDGILDRTSGSLGHRNRFHRRRSL